MRDRTWKNETHTPSPTTIHSGLHTHYHTTIHSGLYEGGIRTVLGHRKWPGPGDADCVPVWCVCVCVCVRPI